MLLPAPSVALLGLVGSFRRKALRFFRLPIEAFRSFLASAIRSAGVRRCVAALSTWTFNFIGSSKLKVEWDRWSVNFWCLLSGFCQKLKNERNDVVNLKLSVKSLPTLSFVLQLHNSLQQQPTLSSTSRRNQRRSLRWRRLSYTDPQSTSPSIYKINENYWNKIEVWSYKLIKPFPVVQCKELEGTQHGETKMVKGSPSVIRILRQVRKTKIVRWTESCKVHTLIPFSFSI
jgi:hypothetical protein